MIQSHRRLGLLASAALAAGLTRGEPAAEQERRGCPAMTQQRFAPFTGSSYDADTRTVDVVLATGMRVKRYWWSEELDMAEAAIDLARVAQNQCRLLFNHDPADPIGVIFDVRVEAGALIGKARFADTPRGREFEGMVARGELTGVSIGYQVRTWSLVELIDGDHEVWRASAWELLEGSLVSVPADPAAGVRSAAVPPGTTIGAPAEPHEESEEMKRSHPGGAAAPAQPAAAAEITGQGGLATVESRGLTAAEVITAQTFARQHGVEEQITPLLTRADATAASVNAAILEAASVRQAGSALPAGAAARVTQDERQVQGEAMVEAIVSRMTLAAPTERARQYRGFRIVDLMAERGGISARDPYDIFQRSVHTTSDFPLLLEAAANKALLSAYTAATPTYRALAARKSFADFKAHKFLRIGEFPDLLPVGEAGEIKAGTIAESREQSSLSTKGITVSLSRQAIINDDLGAFADLTAGAGQAAARMENTMFFTLLLANAALSDTVAMFHATHANLAASGGAIATNTVGAGRAAMRKQKNIGGKETLNIAPSILLVGPDQETAAEQFVSAINPVVAGEVNPFSGKLTVVVDAQITGNQWYLLAAPSVLPNFIYGYLRDQEGPMIAQDTPFGVDGVSLKVLHDFGVGALDFRGAYKNPGQ